MHRLTVFLLCLLCGTLILASNTEAAPLLQEGKRTLYQRVISHPTAQLYAQASDQSQVVDKGLRPFTPLYVYERGQGWLNVGKGTNKADGWIKADLTTPWNQSLTLLFSNRSQRDPVIFFRDTRALQDICDAPDMSERLVSLQLAVAKKKTGPEVVASEPMTSSVDLDRFYLMPILEMQEPYEGTKFLRVASIDPGQIPGSQYHQGKGGTASDPTTKKAPRTGIAIVMDTTVSMQPYIEQSRQLIKTIYDRLQKEKLAEHVGFAFVAFRNSTAAVPELEYVSTVVSDFVTASNRKELESRLAEVREAKVSTHSFNEDSLAGVYNAIESLSWDEYDSRIILLVTDAGPLPSDDRYRSVAMEPQEMADFAGQKGIWIVAVHIKTPAGASNHDYAEQAYRTLSMKNGSAQYQSIKTSNPKEGARYFAAVAESLAKTMEQVVTLTTQGKMLTRPKDAAPKNPEEDAAQLAQRLGYALQLEYLGRANRTPAPQVVSSWITDMDLAHLARGQRVPNVEVAVLLTKAQLNDLHAQIGAIIDNAERTKKTDSTDFFQGILSASARTARDPNMPTQGKTLAELGVLGEFLDGLPYRSEVMLLTEEDWYRKSIGEQTAFINRLKSKLARYEEYDRDRKNWETFGTFSANDWVYRVPLNMLP
ncbi:PpkA [Desulfovibrio sp. An276]|uniref:vWA domain-containing protein n=1 Tax=Desulfovibrio sp. An276 TaxID=1965618 RepID=UPI000B36AECA|nr:vWA domain-containing protein [Desulfovibrio sp. An276]OUO54416.1 PpkA [Desulfovibrio sp. An276]